MAEDDPIVSERRWHFPWLAAVLGALLVVIGAGSLLQLPSPPQPRTPLAREGPRVALRLAENRTGDPSGRLQEELALRDPTPLFLPTQWSSGQASLPLGVRREPGTSVGVFPPKLVFPDDGPAIAIPPPVSVPAGALAAVNAVERVPELRDLSRREQQRPPLPERRGRLVVSEAGTGRVTIAENVVIRPSPSGGSATLRDVFWAPLEMLVAVNPGGLVGQPAVIRTSGTESVDEWVLSFLMEPGRLGARLEPGFYRVLVGP